MADTSVKSAWRHPLFQRMFSARVACQQKLWLFLGIDILFDCIIPNCCFPMKGGLGLDNIHEIVFYYNTCEDIIPETF